MNKRKKEGATNIFEYDRLNKEIGFAHKMGTDVFILDAGWEEKASVWKPNLRSLPRGLKPLVDTLSKKDMQLGVWMSPLIIDTISERFQKHKAWAIEKEGVPDNRWGNSRFF